MLSVADGEFLKVIPVLTIENYATQRLGPPLPYPTQNKVKD